MKGFDDTLSGWESDTPREKCGVFGVIGLEKDLGVRATYLALIGLQHRGQDGAGIISYNENQASGMHGDGLALEVFGEGKHLSGIPDGHIVIGHNRYSTNSGGALQPIMKDHFSIAHNGHIEMLAGEEDRTDTEVLAGMIEDRIQDGADFADATVETLNSIEGAYSLVLASDDMLIGARDPFGLRPLSIGRQNDGQYCLASEDSIFGSIDFTFEREVLPGEVVIITDDGIESRQITTKEEQDVRQATCAFEYIYFARPDTNIDGINVHLARERMGAIMSDNESEGFEADIVVGVPDSGVAAAIGYGKVSELAHEQGALTKNRYISRTFIKDNQVDREKAVRLKQHVNTAITEGQRIVLIDDSIVRGTTTRALVAMLKKEGRAAEVHLRIASPPYRWPCFYGMDTGNPGELIANNMTQDEIRDFLGADSLAYLSVEDVAGAIGQSLGKLCFACANGQYPIKV